MSCANVIVHCDLRCRGKCPARNRRENCPDGSCPGGSCPGGSVRERKCPGETVRSSNLEVRLNFLES